MADKTYDIASQGMASYKDLQDINNGVEKEDDLMIDFDNQQDPPKSKEYYRSNEYLDAQRERIRQLNEYTGGISTNDLLDAYGIDAGDKSEYLSSDRTSRFDERMTDYRQGLNAEDWRSRNQSAFQ